MALLSLEVRRESNSRSSQEREAVLPLHDIYILTTAKLDATGQCWLASLANYDFKLFYKSGCTNVEADALSRTMWNTELDRDPIKTIILAKSSQWSPLCETWGSNLTQ